MSEFTTAYTSDTMLSVDQFRAMFPAFADVYAYPTDEVYVYLALADQILVASRWPEPWRSVGMGLWTAHNLVLNKRDEMTVAAGGVPGGATGIISSKSVGGVSISYDTTSGLEQGAGFWNLSTYGTRFYRMMRLVGMAGTQLGGPDVILNDTFGHAWPGVIYPKV